jgi:SAM-dependent methyltransferase
VPFEHVDVVANATRLPFKDDSVDAVVNESLFEHLPNPVAVVSEIERVLKPGGILYTSTPFLTPYHASPDDFSRWTLSGLGSLFSGFAKIEAGVDAGPWSALLVFLAYWFGVVFSFGYKKSTPTLAFVFMVILGPFKVFDFFFVRLPGSEAVAAQLYFIGKKR